MSLVLWGSWEGLKSRSDLSLRLKSGPDLSPSCPVSEAFKTCGNGVEVGSVSCFGVWNMFSTSGRPVCDVDAKNWVLVTLGNGKNKGVGKWCRDVENDAREKNRSRDRLVMVLKCVCDVEMGVLWSLVSKNSKNE